MRIKINISWYVIFYTMLFLAIIPYDITKVLPSNMGNIIIYLIRVIVLIYGIILICKEKKLCIKQREMIKMTSIYFAFTLTINILATLINSQDMAFFDLIR